MSGSIADKYPIHLVLTIDGSEVVGYYYYEKYLNNIHLKGTLKDSQLVLQESPDFESTFKMGFEGTLVNQQYAGQWKDLDKKRTLPFTVNLDYDQMIHVGEKIQAIEGQYEYLEASEQFTSTIQLKHIFQDTYQFEISNGSANGCTGYLQGLMTINNLTSGNYFDDLCEALEFQIFPDAIKVSEKNCNWHGMRCPFEGSYIKK